MDSNFKDWKYIRDAYSDYCKALTHRYPKELEENKELASAAMDIKKATRVIDSIMAEKAEHEDTW